MTRFRDLSEIEKPAAPPVPAREETHADEGTARFLSPPFLSAGALEQFISLRDAVFKAGSDVHSVGVTSSRKGEGKSTVAIGLALTLAIDTRRRVLLLDANMRASRVHTFFGIPAGPGLSDLMAGDSDFRGAVVQLESFPLCLLPAGSPPAVPPSELLALGPLPSLMRDLKKSFDMIVVDGPAARGVADLDLLGKQLDGVLLVVETDKTQLPLIQEVKKGLVSEELPILGVVLNRCQTGVPAFLNRSLGLE